MPKKKIDISKKQAPIRNGKDAKDIIAQVAKKEARPESKIVPTEQLVTFELDTEEYASIITDLREIIRIPEITPIPGAPDFIRGVLNLRGQIVMVIDLEKRFHLKREHPADPKHIIIAEVEESIFGITVDQVTGVLRIPKTAMRPTPQLITSKIHAEYLKGVVILEELEGAAEEVQEVQEEEQNSKRRKKEKKSRLLLLLDIPKMLAEKELLEFGNAVQETMNKKSR